MFDLLKRTARDFMQDDCPSMSAALAYYTVFALPALLFLRLKLVGVFIDPATVQEQLSGELSGLLGSGQAGQLESMVESAEQRAGGGAMKVGLGIGALLLGATGAFMQLQKALN